jgi:hypothetical protein
VIFNQFDPSMWGARSVAVFPDGSLMLSRGGSVFARPTIDQLRGVGNLRNIATWYNTGGSGELTGWDCQVVGDISDHLVWHQGWDSFFLNDLNAEPGPISPTKIAKGSNIGDQLWGGNFTFDEIGGCYIVRSHLKDIAYFTAEQIDALGPVASNPVPSKTLTTPDWQALDLNVVSIWGIALDVYGGLYVSTNAFAAPWPNTVVYYIEPDDVQQGGTRPVSRQLVAPEPSILSLRLGLGRGVFLR